MHPPPQTSIIGILKSIAARLSATYRTAFTTASMPSSQAVQNQTTAVV